MSYVCAMRDFLIVALCASSLHTALFAWSARDEPASVLPPDTTVACPYYDGWSVAFLALTLTSSATSLYAFANGWDNCERWTWGVDAVGVIPGILWQVSTRPAAYGVGGLPLAWDHCSYEHVPGAQVFHMLGEWLTYGTLLRLTHSAGFGVRLFPTTVILLTAFSTSGLMYVIAALFREHMTARVGL